MTKVKFELEDTAVARSVLAAVLEDASWLDKKKRSHLELGFGMIEDDALLILSRAVAQHGARLIVEVEEKKRREAKADEELIYSVRPKVSTSASVKESK